MNVQARRNSNQSVFTCSTAMQYVILLIVMVLATLAAAGAMGDSVSQMFTQVNGGLSAGMSAAGGV